VNAVLAVSSRILGAFVLAFCLGLVVAGPALAADVRQGQSVVVAPSETVDDDLYVFASSVSILGTVNGDVIAAGSNVTVGGQVNGNVMAAGGSTTITGNVTGSVRAAGGTLEVSGQVGGDVVAGTGSLRLAPSGRIGRDVLVGGGSAELLAAIDRNVLASADTVTLGGPLGGDVHAQANTIHLTPGADIGGSVIYDGASAADVQPGATVHGQITRIEPPNQSAGPTAATAGAAGAAVGWLRGLIGLAAAAVVFGLLLPGLSRRTAATLFASPWPSLGVGLAAFVAIPVVAIVIFGIGLVIGGWWLAFFVLAGYALLGLVGMLSASELVGAQCFGWLRQPPRHPVWSVLLGLLVLWLLALVPVIGGLLLFVTTAFGAGALVLALIQVRRGQPAPTSVPVTARTQLQPASASA
jgi:cytoskeletal protein CcmA (bactofilin family)